MGFLLASLAANAGARVDRAARRHCTKAGRVVTSERRETTRCHSAARPASSGSRNGSA